MNRVVIRFAFDFAGVTREGGHYAKEEASSGQRKAAQCFARNTAPLLLFEVIKKRILPRFEARESNLRKPEIL